jgi:hypothetical protein
LGFPHPTLAAHNQKFVGDVPELFLKTEFVRNRLVLRLTATLGALAVLAGAHFQLLVKTVPGNLQIKLCAKRGLPQQRP